LELLAPIRAKRTVTGYRVMPLGPIGAKSVTTGHKPVLIDS